MCNFFLLLSGTFSILEIYLHPNIKYVLNFFFCKASWNVPGKPGQRLRLPFLFLQRAVPHSSLSPWLPKNSGCRDQLLHHVNQVDLRGSMTAALGWWQEAVVHARQVLMANFTSANLSRNFPKWLRWIKQEVGNTFPPHSPLHPSYLQ